MVIKEAHIERFASRSAGRNVEAAQNKYVRNLSKIRIIQDFILKGSQHLQVHNVALVQNTVHCSLLDSLYLQREY
jgi:2-phosphoglycerate kinase